MLPDIQPSNTKILYFFNCLLDGMHTILFTVGVYYCGRLLLWESMTVQIKI